MIDFNLSGSLLFISFGVFFLILFVLSLKSVFSFKKNGVETVATILNSRVETKEGTPSFDDSYDSGEPGYCRTVINYGYSVDGKNYQGEKTYDDDARLDIVGKAINILYLRNDPQQSILKEEARYSSKLFIMNIFFLLISFLFFLVGIWPFFQNGN